MKRIFKIGMFCLCSLAVTSCDYLDVKPNEFITEEDVWTDVRQAEMLVNRVYSLIDNDGKNGLSIAGEIMAGTDEAKHHWENPWIWKVAYGSWNPSDNGLDIWRTRYEDIRIANKFLDNIAKVSYPENESDYWKARIPQYIGEVKVLRAWFYYQLIERYGALPIVKEAMDNSNTQKLQIPRNSMDEVVTFLVTDLQAAADALPLTHEKAEKGRVTKGTALALKAKVLLLNASPLFNGNSLYAEVKNKDGKQLFNQTYDKKHWLEAANAAKAVLDLSEGGTPVYKLANKYPDNPVKNYAYQFYTRDYDEAILFRIRWNERGTDQSLLPNGTKFNGNGKYTVTQEMVDSYEMSNGYPIHEQGSGYTTEGVQEKTTLFDGNKDVEAKEVSNRFVNRDPRFYATIFFQGGVWRYKESKRQLHYAFWDNGSNDKEGWPKRGTNCESGYNIRKWCSPDVNIKPSNKVDPGRVQYFIRLSEVYLMYAEAMNEYLEKPDKQVYDAINAVRSRVSMPPLPILESDKTKEGMRKRIQNEYRVELAFENRRFFDVRRWMIGKEMFGKPLHGLNAQPTTEEMDATGIMNKKDKKRGLIPFFKEVVIDENRLFEDRHYLFPIPQSEMNICNEFLVQNYGW